MRFAALHLRAYGHFTDRVLELPHGGGGDLHLIVGANEAGKSTLLAAVRDLLFGFPHAVERNFLHEAPRQRVGATVERGDGTKWHLLRRRGRTNTLRPFDPETGAEDTANPQDAALQALLSGGLDRAAYRHLFGLDLHSLIEGGEALLQGEGEVGQSLFQAAAGVARLRKLQHLLRDEANALFNPHGHAIHPLLNQAIRRHREAGEALKAATVRTNAWLEAERALAEAEREYTTVQTERDTHRRRQRLLERVQHTLPRLAERQHLIDRLASLAGLPLLAADARDRRREAEDSLQTAQRSIATKTTELEQKTTARAAVVLHPALLERALSVSGLFQRIPGSQAALEGRGQEQALHAQAMVQVREQGRALGLEVGEPETLRRSLPSVAARARVVALARQEALLRQAARDQRARMRGLEAQRDAASGTLASLPPPGDLTLLGQLLEQLATLGPIADAAERAQAESAARLGAAAQAAARLGHSDADALAQLVTPARAEVESLRQRFERLATERQRQQAQAEELARQRTQTEARLAAEVATAEVLTETGLADARSDRDAALRLLFRGWLDGEETARQRLADRAGAGGPTALAAYIGEAVTQADHLADTLRADAGRVERHAALARELERNSAQEEALVGAQGRLEREAGAAASEWQALLSPLGLQGIAPEALLEWMQGHREFLQLHDRSRSARQQLENARAEHRRLLGALDDALARFGLGSRGADEVATTAKARLQALRNDLQQTATQREVLQARQADARRDLQALAPDLREAEEALARWEQQWADAMGAIGLACASLPAEAEARIERFGALERTLAEVEACSARAEAHQHTIAAFEADVARLAESLGETASMDATQALGRVEAWHETMAYAGRARDRAEQLDAELESLRESIDEARRAQQSAQGTLDVLCRDADVGDVAALPVIEAQAQARRDAEQQLGGVEASLREQFAQSIEALVEEAGAHTLDDVKAELDRLTGEILGAESEAGKRLEALITARQRFSAIDGSNTAALQLQEQAVTAAEIDTLARRWVRVRLANTLLGQVIERWLAHHQGPLLERASAIFARLTLGSFEGLTTDYDDDQQHLLGVRPGGSTVGVNGMSQGTRDQLFLALRLATIESHLASRGPFPVIADDLLVQFDDDRALATLGVLMELSARTQVLVFTHHRHLVEIAETADLTRRLHVLEL